MKDPNKDNVAKLTPSKIQSVFNEKYENSKKIGLNCLYYNADSLLNKFSELELIIDEEDPGVIFINESLPKNRV